MGARWTPEMSASNTLCVTCARTGEKVLKAKEWDIPVVNHLYLEDCCTKWQRISPDEMAYLEFPVGVDLQTVVGSARLDTDLLKPWVKQADAWTKRRGRKQRVGADRWALGHDPEAPVVELTPDPEVHVPRMRIEDDEEIPLPEELAAEEAEQADAMQVDEPPAADETITVAPAAKANGKGKKRASRQRSEPEPEPEEEPQEDELADEGGGSEEQEEDQEEGGDEEDEDEEDDDEEEEDSEEDARKKKRKPARTSKRAASHAKPSASRPKRERRSALEADPYALVRESQGKTALASPGKSSQQRQQSSQQREIKAARKPRVSRQASSSPEQEEEEEAEEQSEEQSTRAW